jgi:hypothetical protein
MAFAKLRFAQILTRIRFNNLPKKFIVMILLLGPLKGGIELPDGVALFVLSVRDLPGAALAS